MIDIVKQATRQAQYHQIIQHVKDLGHPVESLPELVGNKATFACPRCGLRATMKAKTIKLPEGKVNHQLKTEGFILTERCKASVH